MLSPRSRLTMAAVAGASWSLSAAALGQPAPAAPEPPPPASRAQGDQDVEARKSEAREAFERGLALFEREAWEGALAEFVRSRSTYPTRAATKNAALCLRKLRRFDEALDLFEEMLKFSNLNHEDRSVAETAIAELEGRVGTLRIEAAEPGASLVIDGRYRGILPLSGPLRVSAGSHEVRAYKEASDPFGATVDVAARRETVAEIRSLSTRGRLRVSEQHGRALEVIVDGAVVGKTPWEGPLEVGEHLVTLQGRVDLDAALDCAPREQGAEAAPARRPARGNVEFGTQPASVPIRLREVTKLTLTAEELDTSLRVEPTPGGASVAIDSVVVGRGTWEGRLRVGPHTVEVTAAGFVPETRHLDLERQKRQVLTIALRREGSPLAPRTTRAAAGAAYGVGALGLGTFVATGVLALGKINGLKSRCHMNVCPPSEQGNLDSAHALEKVATTGLVLGGAGVVAGTVVLLVGGTGGGERRAGAAPPAGGVTWTAAVGPGRLEIAGRF